MLAEVAISNPGLLDLFEDAEADRISQMNEGDGEMVEKCHRPRGTSGNSWAKPIFRRNRFLLAFPSERKNNGNTWRGVESYVSTLQYHMISSYVLSCKTKVIYMNMYSYFDECETIEI